MSEPLRWTLILGCLLLAILEAPRSALVLVQDLRGPWRAEPVASAPAPSTTKPRSRALKQDGAFASVAPEEVLGPDCCPADRLALELASGKFAFLFAR